MEIRRPFRRAAFSARSRFRQLLRVKMLRSDAPHHTHWLRGSESAKAHVFETPLDDALCPVLLQTRAANLLDSIRTACAFWRAARA